MGLGWPEMLIIAVIIIVLFGSRRIPEVAKGLGQGIRNFKSGLHGDDRPAVEDRKYRDEAERREESHRSA
jgi:sec-independent protein translocase protein TatA